MRILLVEDDVHQAEKLIAEIRGTATIAVARSHDEARELINSSWYDLVICDLRLPSTVGSLDAAETRGVSLVGELRDLAPGTPVLVFSAHGDNPAVLKGLLEDQRRADPFGAGADQAMLEFVEKSDFSDCVKLVQAGAAHLQDIARIGVSSGTTPVVLDEQQRRVMQIFARTRGGAELHVTELAGGLTQARTLRVSVHDGAGAQTARAVAKIDRLSNITRELRAYDQYIVGYLPSGSFTPRTYVAQSGAADVGGIFYTLEDDIVGSLMDLLRADPQAALKVIATLRQQTSAWLTGVGFETTNVRAVRDMLVPKIAITESELPTGAAAFEASELRVRLCPQHADLHGFNVLVHADQRPVLIDFASARRAPAALDPITLELGLVFHPASPWRGSWPSGPTARDWRDIDKYLRTCPYAEYVRACRSWAYAVAASDREVHATLYAYGLRQLAFKDTDKDVANALIQAAISAS